jgi:hypothetical protein
MIEDLTIPLPASSSASAGLARAGSASTSTTRLLAKRNSYAIPGGDNVRLHLAADNVKQLQQIAAKIAAVTGKKPSHSVILRAGLHALDSHVQVASKELGRRTAGQPNGIKMTNLMLWLTAAARCVAGM